jgi:predicted metalloprotease
VVALLYQAGVIKPSGNSNSRDQDSRRASKQAPATSNGSDDTVLERDELTDFLTFLINDVNEVWDTKFEEELSKSFRPATLVIFEGTTDTRCGPRKARSGPAYCPADKKMYVPPSFFWELKEDLGAAGDFAQAIVLAHELGHHVQSAMGISRGMYKEAKSASKSKARDLKIRHELQADCFAGLWAQTAKERDLLEQGDLEEALTAAAAIGDDSLQKMAGRRVDESKWSHGSAAQRKKWFKKGFSTGDYKKCDTFAVARP